MQLVDLKSKGLVRTARAPAVANAGFPFELGKSGLHEVAESSYGDRAAATGFLLSAIRQSVPGVWVWVRQTSVTLDNGNVPDAALKLRSSRLCLTVHARTAREALWATEEAIISGAANLIVAELDGADFTATRRLALASGRYGVPVVLLLPYSCEGPTAASTRWRVSPRPSAPNRYDQHAPGHSRWRAVLERCRMFPSAAGQAFDLEWNDETLSLSVVTGLAAGPAAPRAPASSPETQRKAG